MPSSSNMCPGARGRDHPLFASYTRKSNLNKSNHRFGSVPDIEHFPMKAVPLVHDPWTFWHVNGLVSEGETCIFLFGGSLALDQRQKSASGVSPRRNAHGRSER